ncbi:MAG: hypothetical protein ABR955_06425 [Verrucomicrobiota bacterium]
MSLKQIEANRRNAQKSTGPKTPNGQAVSKMNALKHGLLSKVVLVRGIYARESKREFHVLQARFRAHLNPVGPVEEMLVDQIVTAHWRLRRVLKAESGEIALSVDEGHWTRYTRNPGLDFDVWLAHDDASFAMSESVLGIQYLEKRLKEIREALVREGELTEAALQSVLKYFSGKPNMLTDGLKELREYWLQNPDGLEAIALRTKHQRMVHDFIDNEFLFLAGRKIECSEREEAEEESRQAAAMLPPMEVLDKIMRYETPLKRQLYRAMNQLERLQRMRLGEAIPPPLMMEMSERS